MLIENVPLWHRAMHRRRGVWLCEFLSMKVLKECPTDQSLQDTGSMSEWKEASFS